MNMNSLAIGLLIWTTVCWKVQSAFVPSPNLQQLQPLPLSLPFISNRRASSADPCLLYPREQDDSVDRSIREFNDHDSPVRRFTVPRRSLLQTWSAAAVAAALTTPTAPAWAAKETSLGEEYRQGALALDKPSSSSTIQSSDLETMVEVPRDAYIKLPSGVIYADLRPGASINPVVTEGSRVNIQWVLRKSNGYFVDSSERQSSVPFIFTVGDGTAIAGLDQGIRGMRLGGTRRLLIPPSLAYVKGLEDGLPGPLPAGYGPRQQMRRVQGIRKDVPGEYIYLEIQATRVR
jgi:FKBP-type peptidyl-prolyl cis-trans isomerase